jgi:hypothetical protein
MWGETDMSDRGHHWPIIHPPGECEHRSHGGDDAVWGITPDSSTKAL